MTYKGKKGGDSWYEKYESVTMPSTVFCWDCAKPLPKGVEISTKCPCHTKKNKKKGDA